MMQMAADTLDRHIEVTPGTCAGKPRIAGRRITVEQVAIWHERLLLRSPAGHRPIHRGVAASDPADAGAHAVVGQAEAGAGMDGWRTGLATARAQAPAWARGPRSSSFAWPARGLGAAGANRIALQGGCRSRLQPCLVPPHAQSSGEAASGDPRRHAKPELRGLRSQGGPWEREEREDLGTRDISGPIKRGGRRWGRVDAERTARSPRREGLIRVLPLIQRPPC
jgi:hypothetical protein